MHVRKQNRLRKSMEEKAEEAKEDGEKIAISEGIQDENEIVKDRAEKLLSEKLENATDGEVYLDNEDMQVIIDAPKIEKLLQPTHLQKLEKILILKI